MAMASRLKWYLGVREVDYEIVRHEHSSSSLGSAKAAHVPSGRVAKCVLLEDERGYMLAIVPASCRIDLAAVEKQLNRKLELARESELADVFPDCEVGAVPAVGAAYNLPTLLDDALLRLPDIYLESGDHEDLVHLSGEAFHTLVGEAAHGPIARLH